MTWTYMSDGWLDWYLWQTYHNSTAESGANNLQTILIFGIGNLQSADCAPLSFLEKPLHRTPAAHCASPKERRHGQIPAACQTPCSSSGNFLMGATHGLCWWRRGNRPVLTCDLLPECGNVSFLLLCSQIVRMALSLPPSLPLWTVPSHQGDHYHHSDYYLYSHDLYCIL